MVDDAMYRRLLTTKADAGATAPSLLASLRAGRSKFQPKGSARKGIPVVPVHQGHLHSLHITTTHTYKTTASLDAPGPPAALVVCLRPEHCSAALLACLHIAMSRRPACPALWSDPAIWLAGFVLQRSHGLES